MRYPASEKLEIARLVEQSHQPAKWILDKLGVRRRSFIDGMVDTWSMGRTVSLTVPLIPAVCGIRYLRT